jgi:hypothetical protein
MFNKFVQQIDKSCYFTLNKKRPHWVGAREKEPSDILGRIKIGPVIVFDPYSPDPAAASDTSQRLFLFIKWFCE